MKKILFLLVCIPMVLNAQVLRVSVDVGFDHLSPIEQQHLQNFKSQIEDYYNNFSWTDDEFETDIETKINIIIEVVTEKSFERIYKAQFLIKSISGESFYDKEWEFPYQRGYIFDHSKVQFDPLCNFLDYYAYMILAGELDTYGHTMGTVFYDAALNIANRGILSEYPRGWSKRLEELLKITHIRTRPLREAKPDFFEAVYLFQEGKYDEARTLGLKVLDAIGKVVNEQPNNKYLRFFFDAHYMEFAKIFAGDGDSLERLIEYDNRHRETYREAL
jgi:hypothetical protein